MRFRYHPEAEEELLHSIRYYESKAEGLGAEFLDEVEKTLALIQSFPDLGTLLTETDRRDVGGKISVWSYLHKV